MRQASSSAHATAVSLPGALHHLRWSVGQMHRLRRFIAGLSFGVAIGVGMQPSLAQIVAPSQLTPPTLRPSIGTQETPPRQIEQPIAPHLGAGGALKVLVRNVEVKGGFDELAGLTEEKSRELIGHRVTVSEIYRVARTIEIEYSRAGFPLVRVVVPPQKLVDGGSLTLAVVDGFIEEVDVSAVPSLARAVVAKRVAGLVGRRHLKLSDIERAILIAGDVPGLKLRSTLAAGKSEGGTRLVLDGVHHIVSGSVGGDNRLVQSLGTWELRGAIAVNSALGFGEQIYGTVGHGADLNVSSSPFKLVGAGAVIPFGNDGITINPEYTNSTTRTAQNLAAPASNGTFERFALRLRDPVLWTRDTTVNATASLEYIKQRIDAPDFAATLNEDRYGALRLGVDYNGTLPSGTSVQSGLLLSQGLGGRSEADVLMSSVPLSRLGASPDFTKLNASFRIAQPLPQNFALNLIGSGQLSFGKPVFRSEQYSFDGAEGVSAFAAGTFATDQGVAVRAEIERHYSLNLAARTVDISPYGFGAAGWGWLANATAVERPEVDAFAVGFGVRGRYELWSNFSSLIWGIELARGFTDLAGLRQGWRGNVNATVVF